MTTRKTSRKTTKIGGVAALLASGLVAGGVLAGSLTANAADSSTATTTPPAATATAPTNPNAGDPTKSQRPDEHLLTGTTAAKVKAAALAKYPGATVQRIETDSDGVYEAHLLKADGTPVTVEVNAAFAVTGDEAMGAPPAGTQG